MPAGLTANAVLALSAVPGLLARLAIQWATLALATPSVVPAGVIPPVGPAVPSPASSLLVDLARTLHSAPPAAALAAAAPPLFPLPLLF